MKLIILLLVFLSPIVSACSPIKMAKRVAGTSAEALEKEEEGRFSFIFLRNLPDSYAATKKILKEKQVTIYLENEEEKYLVAMGFDRLFPRSINTTEVGIFFQEKDDDETQIDVVSFNRDLAQFGYKLLSEQNNHQAP